MFKPQIRGINAFLLLLFGTLAVCASARGETSVPFTEMVLGNPDAPITVVEYISLTCPHCATFHQETFPKLQTQYITTGKVRFIVRDYPLDRTAFHAAVLVRCAGPDRYHNFLKVLFKQQSNWSNHRDPLLALTMLGILGGVTEKKFLSCLNDEALTEKVLSSRLEAHERYEITSTPSFLINGVKHSGLLSFTEFEEILAPLLATE